MPPISLDQSTAHLNTAATVLELVIPGNHPLSDEHGAPRWLWVKRSGTFQFVDHDGNIGWLYGQAGTVIPFSPARILRTGGAVLYCAY